jgi:signal transduction histidine kinase
MNVAGRSPGARFDRRQRATGLGGVAMLAGLALAITPQAPVPLAVAVTAAGVLAAAAMLTPPALQAVYRHRGLGLVIVLVGLGALWVVSGVRHANGATNAFGGPNPQPGIPYPFVFSYARMEPLLSADWPWRIGRISLLPLVLTLLSAAGGLVLLADAVRVQLGLAPLAPRQRAPWRVLTASQERRSRIAWRMVPGVLLIGLAAFVAIGLADRYAAGDAPLQAIALIGVGGWAAVLIAGPLLVGSLMRVDRDKAGRAREEERQRFAAHLHDSVLQTLALVQRQAHDPDAVIRLARRQEHALRAWMAGEAELASETLAGAVRDIVAEVEDEYTLTIELTAIGDRPLDSKGEALVAAAREALRNAARHAPGAPVFVFCEIGSDRAEVFVRDEGPGFEPDGVASERRGIRDAMIGRMAVSGGRATIESTLGEGTEVALLLGPAVNGR